MLDARGHGESDKPHASYYYWNRAMAQDVKALAEHLGLQEYSLMGHAIRAEVAVEAALMYSGIRGLVMVGFFVYDDWRYDEAERMVRVKIMVNKKACTGDKYRKSAELHKVDRKAFAARLQGAIIPEFTRSELKRIRIPVLVVNGSQDEYSAPDAAGCFPTPEGIMLEGSSCLVFMNGLLLQAAEFLEMADRLV
jgi:pimeloyl-ACP methyl ester carboxylesterase